MNISLTKPQAEFFQSTAKATAAVAGFGAGKTQGTVYRLIATMLEYPDADMLYSAPTIPLIKDILWDKLDELLPQIGLTYSINKAESIVYIQNHGKIYCRSMDNPARLVGFEVLDAFMDELDILPTEKALDVYRKIKARCRQKCYKKDSKTHKLKRKINQQWVTTTPEGYKATYELFKKNPLPSSRLIRMTTYSNPYLSEDYIEDLRSNYPEQLIDAYLMGKFVNLTSSPVWASYDPELNDAPKGILKKKDKLHIGMDFNVGRGCAVVYVKRTLPIGHPNNPTSTPYTPQHLKEPWPVLIAVGEVIDSLDTPDTIRVLEEKFPKKDFPTRIVYPDASGKGRKSVNATTSDITLLKQAGFIVKKNSKNPNIKDRVTAANACFCNAKNETKVYVCKKEVPVFSDALVKQVYDKNGLPEKGLGKGDDVTDAGTYPLAYMFPIKRTMMFVDNTRGA